MSLLVTGVLVAHAAQAQEAGGTPSTLDTVHVAANYGYQPVEVKKSAATIVDSVTYDDIEAPTGDNSIASMLIQVPGVSWVGDGDEPRYVSLRGISPDLNVTTLDGLNIATIGESGSGARRVNLQLIPSDISERVDVYKSVTAEQDAAGIGGVVDIVTRSAFSTPSPYFMLDGYGIYSTFEGPAGENSGGADGEHWGKGLKTALSRRFGNQQQFGVAFTARYQDRVRNSNKTWTDSRVYFDEAGAPISYPDPELGWDGRNSLNKFAYGDYSNVITNKGASVKFEWRPGTAVSSFLMGYWYDREEESTMNSTDIIADNQRFADRDADSGTAGVSYVQSTMRGPNQWRRTASGATSGLDWRIDDRSLLSFRGGYTKEVYNDWQPYAQVRTRGALDDTFVYDMGGSKPQLRDYLGDPLANPYNLRQVNYTDNDAEENVLDLRADYAFNVAPGSLGFGLKTGVEWRRLRIGKDVDSVRYVVGGDITGYMYDPGYSHYGSNGLAVPWLNYGRFWNEAAPGLPVDEQASEYYSRNSDYFYSEEIANGYVSLHYAGGRTHYVAGLRYDDASYDGRSALSVDGELTDGFARPGGSYRNWLPSFNVSHDLSEVWKLRAGFSRTIGRPNPSQIAQAESQACGEGEVTGCIISRGNPDLKPRRSKNYDVALERYFESSDSLVALSLFRKDIADDIFTLRTLVERDGLVDQVNQPMNADTSRVQGAELALVNRAFAFHPNLGAALNVSRIKGEMNYASNSGDRHIGRLVDQPDWMANLTLSYEIPAIRGTARLSANYQDDYLEGVGANHWNDKYKRRSTTVDFSLWHQVAERWTFKYELDNIFGANPEWYHGRNVGGTLSQRDHYGRGAYVHAIYSFN